jgi:hypothetical protein
MARTNTRELCSRNLFTQILAHATTLDEWGSSHIRITLNKRADTAAAAMVKRMMMRRRPLVFLLVVPRKKGSSGVSETAAAMMAGVRRSSSGWRGEWAIERSGRRRCGWEERRVDGERCAGCDLEEVVACVSDCVVVDRSYRYSRAQSRWPHLQLPAPRLIPPGCSLVELACTINWMPAFLEPSSTKT